jgi:hypothetical protein
MSNLGQQHDPWLYFSEYQKHLIYGLMAPDQRLITELVACLSNFKGQLTPPDLELLEQAKRRIGK